MLLSELNYMGNTLPKCPHCGENFPVWSDDHPLNLSYEDGGRATFECESCKKDFICVTQVTHLFSTAVSDERANDEEWGPQPDEITEADDGSEALAKVLCDGCGGHGLVGDILNTTDCPFCNGTGYADPECVTPQDNTPPELKAVLADALAKQNQ